MTMGAQHIFDNVFDGMIHFMGQVIFK